MLLIHIYPLGPQATRIKMALLEADGEGDQRSEAGSGHWSHSYQVPGSRLSTLSILTAAFLARYSHGVCPLGAPPRGPALCMNCQQEV